MYLTCTCNVPHTHTQCVNTCNRWPSFVQFFLRATGDHNYFLCDSHPGPIFPFVIDPRFECGYLPTHTHLHTSHLLVMYIIPHTHMYNVPHMCIYTPHMCVPHTHVHCTSHVHVPHTHVQCTWFGDLFWNLSCTGTYYSPPHTPCNIMIMESLLFFSPTNRSAKLLVIERLLKLAETYITTVEDQHLSPRTILPHGASYQGHPITMQVTCDSPKYDFVLVVSLEHQAFYIFFSTCIS